MWQAIKQSEGYQNIAKHFAKLGWMGVVHELSPLIWLFVSIVVVLALTHFVMYLLERRGPKR